MPIAISGFTLVRNASLLDFPVEASIRSLLPVVDECVVNVGASEDDTLLRVRKIANPKLRIIESDWDDTLGPAMLAIETERARAACGGRWGIAIQADEVFADGAAERLADAIAAVDGEAMVEGVVVDFRHFYGDADTIATGRGWYRRECRAIRLDPSHQIHSFRDAQGFRVGPMDRRIRCRAVDAVMHHYGWARPDWALKAKRAADRVIYPWRGLADPARPLLPWQPGLRAFTGEHPTVIREWIETRRDSAAAVAVPAWRAKHLAQLASLLVEEITGWRPFEYRNYEER